MMNIDTNRINCCTVAEIKKAKQDMESKIYDVIKEFESKTSLIPHSIDLDIEYMIGGSKHIFLVKSKVEL